MDTVILQELQLIRLYVFILMAVFVISFLSKLYVNWKKAVQIHFENKVENFIDKGEYDKAIKACTEKLKKYQNHLYATWFIAKAYYYTEDYSQAKFHFEKTLHLSPSWEKSVEPYIVKLNNL